MHTRPLARRAGHHPDCAQWGMGTDYTGPVRIRNAEGEFPPDTVCDTATEYYFEAVYANGVLLAISNRLRGAVTWIACLAAR